MEYLVSAALALMAATIMAADGDNRDGSYETDYLRKFDLSYNSGNGLGFEGGGHGHEQGGHAYEQGGHGKDYYAEPHYAFAYEVHDDHTGDIKAHKEERKGDHTQGMYMLVEPNGSKRIVEYVVQGKSGFNAKVHQSKPQELQGGHGTHTGAPSGDSGYAGGHTGQSSFTGGQAGHSGYTGGQAGHSGYFGGQSGHSGYTGGQASHSGYSEGQSGHSGYTGGQASHSGYSGGQSGHSGYTGGQASHSGYSGGQSGYGGYTGGQAGHSGYAGGSHTNSLGDYATGYYTHAQSPYKVQENTPNYNYKPLISYKPTLNLQPFKPLIPYVPTDPQRTKNSFSYSKPLIALYRPHTSYKPLSTNKPTSYKFIPIRKQNLYNNQHSRDDSHATSSVSFSSHGSKIASTTNHVIPQLKTYENKH